MLQVYKTDMFDSPLVEINSDKPPTKSFELNLPVGDNRGQKYCNIFVQYGDGPWTLLYNR